MYSLIKIRTSETKLKIPSLKLWNCKGLLARRMGFECPVGQGNETLEEEKCPESRSEMLAQEQKADALTALSASLGVRRASVVPALAGNVF